MPWTPISSLSRLHIFRNKLIGLVLISQIVCLKFSLIMVDSITVLSLIIVIF